MSISTLILLAVLIIDIGLLIFILDNKNKEWRWQIFSIVFLITLWQAIRFFTDALQMAGFDDYYVLVSHQAGLVPALFLPLAFTWLAFSLFGRWGKLSLWQKILYWLPPLIMTLFSFTSYNMAMIRVSGADTVFAPGPLYWWFIIYFILSVSYDLYLLMLYRKRYNIIIQRQINYIFIATALATASGLLFSAVLPIFGINAYYYIGINGTIFFTAILTYSLFRYRFFDLGISFYSLIIDLFRLFILALIYYVLFLIISHITDIDLSINNHIVHLLIFVGLTITPLFRIIDKFVKAMFINPMNDIKVAENNIADILRSSQDFKFLFSNLTKEIRRVVNYDDFFVYLSRRNKPEHFQQVFPVGERLITLKESNLLKFLAKEKNPANLAEIQYLKKDKALAKEMKDRHIDIALPIFYDKQLLGVIIIDNNGKLLSVQQLNFLEQLNKYLDIAVGSLLMHQRCIAEK